VSEWDAVAGGERSGGHTGRGAVRAAASVAPGRSVIGSWRAAVRLMGGWALAGRFGQRRCGGRRRRAWIDLAAGAPSVVLSQKHDVAVCNPAPFFCMSTAVTATAGRGRG